MAILDSGLLSQWIAARANRQSRRSQERMAEDAQPSLGEILGRSLASSLGQVPAQAAGAYLSERIAEPGREEQRAFQGRLQRDQQGFESGMTDRREQFAERMAQEAAARDMERAKFGVTAARENESLGAKLAMERDAAQQAARAAEAERAFSREAAARDTEFNRPVRLDAMSGVALGYEPQVFDKRYDDPSPVGLPNFAPNIDGGIVAPAGEIDARTKVRTFMSASRAKEEAARAASERNRLRAGEEQGRNARATFAADAKRYADEARMRWDQARFSAEQVSEDVDRAFRAMEAARDDLARAKTRTPSVYDDEEAIATAVAQIGQEADRREQEYLALDRKRREYLKGMSVSRETPRPAPTPTGAGASRGMETANSYLSAEEVNADPEVQAIKKQVATGAMSPEEGTSYIKERIAELRAARGGAR